MIEIFFVCLFSGLCCALFLMKVNRDHEKAVEELYKPNALIINANQVKLETLIEAKKVLESTRTRAYSFPDEFGRACELLGEMAENLESDIKESKVKI